MRFTSDAQRKSVFAKMRIKDGYVSMVPFDRISDPTVGLGYKKRTLSKWLESLGGKAVPPLILRPSLMGNGKYAIWDGRHRYAVMEMQKWPLVPARIYNEGKLVYPEAFKRKRFEGDETKQARLGEEYRYLW